VRHCKLDIPRPENRVEGALVVDADAARATPALSALGIPEEMATRRELGLALRWSGLVGDRVRVGDDENTSSSSSPR